MTGQSGSRHQRSGKESNQPETPAGDSGTPAWLEPNQGSLPGWASSVNPIDLLEQALVDQQHRDDITGQARILARLAVARYAAGDVEGAGSAAVECERVASLAADAHSRPWGTLVQSLLAYDRGELEEALSRAQDSLDQFRATGEKTHVWRATMTCMLASKSLGRLMEARDYCLETIELVERCGEEEKATALPELAALVLALGYPTEAIVVYSAGFAAAERLGLSYPPAALERYRARIATARSRLPAAEFDAARTDGEALPAVEALDQVRRCVSSGRSRTSLPA